MHPEKQFPHRLALSYLAGLREQAMAILEQDKLYGQLIVDFANAKTTDEAGINFVKGIGPVS